jgi:hypothetical protein
MAEDQGPKLSQHLAGKYEMKNGVQPGPALVKIDHGHEEVDFRTMTVDVKTLAKLQHPERQPYKVHPGLLPRTVGP